MYIVTIQKCGNDYFIHLPQEVIDILGLENGDQLEMRIENEKLIMQKVYDA